MADCAELELTDRDLGCLFAYYGRPRIVIDNIFTWLEWFILVGITHESIHLVLYELLGSYEIAGAFDNWFGNIDPSVLLVAEIGYQYDDVMRERVENLWSRLKVKPVHRKPRCTFDLRRNCPQTEARKMNCGNCSIGKKLGVEKVSLTFVAE